MDSARHIQNLTLVGFMGAGKSSVGRFAADALHFTFLDTDHVIESRAGKSITEIFAELGEPAFRALEHKLVLELERRSRTVIATGGGLPVNPENMASLKSHSLVICLWASPEALYERVRAHDHRPLLKEGEPLERIRSLLAARAPFYKEADVLINTEMRSTREVALQVVHQFHLAHHQQQQIPPRGASHLAPS